MLAVGDYLQDDFSGLTAPLLGNAETTVHRANLLTSYYYHDNPQARRLSLASGRRTPERNAQIPGAAVQSLHLTCEAIDLGEPKAPRPFARWCVANLHLLADIGLWMEDPRCTVGNTTSWVHLQTRAPGSGARVFIPSAAWARRLMGDLLDLGDIK